MREGSDLIKFSEQYDTTLMLENGEEKFEHYKYVLDNVPELKVHFDVGHAFISGGINTIRKFISYFGDRIAHIHIHDNHGKQDEHLALKKGKINWKKVVYLLKKIEYDKTITIEVFKSDKGLIKSREYFRKLWYKI
jgi:sugar phosphate isomerase/epimerase